MGRELAAVFDVFTPSVKRGVAALTRVLGAAYFLTVFRVEHQFADVAV